MNHLNEQYLKSDHQIRVEIFMGKMGFTVPSFPRETLRDEDRLLMAQLLFEEVMETINKGLGVDIYMKQIDEIRPVDMETVDFDTTPHYDVIETIDGVCDVKFVATKLLSLIGVPDTVFQSEVDNNNICKFAGDGHQNADGKWVKPTDHPKPNIERLFTALSR
jgi:predicted HAD superfamily Cof-like phosphohydrolase